MPESKRVRLLAGLEMEVGKTCPYPFLYSLLLAVLIFLHSSVL